MYGCNYQKIHSKGVPSKRPETCNSQEQVALQTRHLCLRPYHVECTGSRPITEVKQHRAWLVLGWVTA